MSIVKMRLWTVSSICIGYGPVQTMVVTGDEMPSSEFLLDALRKSSGHDHIQVTNLARGEEVYLMVNDPG